MSEEESLRMFKAELNVTVEELEAGMQTAFALERVRENETWAQMMRFGCIEKLYRCAFAEGGLHMLRLINERVISPKRRA